MKLRQWPLGLGVLALLGLALIVVVTRGLTAAEAPEARDRAIVAAMTPYVEEHSAAGLSAQITVERVDGDYARLQLVPNDPSVGIAYGYAQRINGIWTPLTMGTGFDDAFYAQHGVPASLRLDH